MRGTILVLALALVIVPQVLPNSYGQHKGFATTQDDTMLLGDVSVRSASNGNIVVIVDQSLNNATDGVPDLVFRFAPKKKKDQYKNVSLDLQRARVFFSSRRLAVISQNGYVMVSLSLEKIQEADLWFTTYGNRASDLPETVRISRGLGLKRQTPKRADDGSYLPVNIEEDFIARGVSPQNEPGPGGCSSGGAGATSCSISCGGGQGCSVGCGGGLTACCNCPHDCGCTR